MPFSSLPSRSNKNTERTASKPSPACRGAEARTCWVAGEASREEEDSGEEKECGGSRGQGRGAASRGLGGAADPGGLGWVGPVIVRERVVGAASAGVEEAAAGLPVLRHEPEAVLLLVLVVVLGHHHHGRDGGRRRRWREREGLLCNLVGMGWRELVSCT
jgi:hypothetical protein